MRTGVQETMQVPGERRVKVQSGQLTGENETRFQARFPGTFPAEYRLGGEKHDIQHPVAGSRPHRVHQECDPGCLRRYPCFLQEFTAGAPGQALPVAWRTAGQHPVVKAVAGAMHEQHRVLVDHDDRTADVMAAGHDIPPGYQDTAPDGPRGDIQGPATGLGAEVAPGQGVAHGPAQVTWLPSRLTRSGSSHPSIAVPWPRSGRSIMESTR